MRIVDRQFKSIILWLNQLLSSNKQFFGYMNLIPFPNSRLCFVPRNKFQIKGCQLKDNRGYVFLALNKKMPGHGLPACVLLDGAAQTVM